MERLMALFLLILLSPLILILYLTVKLTSKGSFIFKQKRMGKDFKPFVIYKIRTMIEGAEKQKTSLKTLNEADGPVFKIRNDPRYTPIGRFLSHTGLDEILQLVNIIKGEMSFVGPRPLPVDEALKVPRQYHKRFSVLPGITSFWVIRGAHFLTFKQWMESDLEYIKKKNFFLDLYIILATGFLSLKWAIKKLF